jgi:hypothetical protein
VVVGTGVTFCEERASDVGRRRQRLAITTNVSDERKKATRAYPVGSPAKKMHCNKHASPVGNYW